MNTNKYLHKDNTFDNKYNNHDNDYYSYSDAVKMVRNNGRRIDIQCQDNSMIGKKYETYYYCGEHVDGCDRDGPIRVYHYISKSKLNGRNIDTLNFWEGELEFWPGDTCWLEASRKKEFIVEE